MSEIKELKGSRLRCSMLSRMSPEIRQVKLQEIVWKTGVSDFILEFEEECKYYPQDDVGIGEYRFSDKNGLVEETLRKKLIKWWLDIDIDTNRQTPNWDFACDAIINGKKGLILVEAKSYKEELIHHDPWTVKSEHSKQAISSAITDANDNLNRIYEGFSLNWDSYYQLSNRFAWSWKLASEGIPVVLIYLGFLNCEEMNSNSRSILRTKEDWSILFRDDLNHVIPYSIWNKPINVGNASFFPIIATGQL
ncbi:MAG: hypothetical protein PHY48_12425 [Candidatus Cloacimonetes bacterium]|nr:hypothetical protein [Candidatus Cloacimonadota bacterium]